MSGKERNGRPQGNPHEEQTPGHYGNLFRVWNQDVQNRRHQQIAVFVLTSVQHLALFYREQQGMLVSTIQPGE